MSSTVTYKCPNCGAGLLFDPESAQFKCEFCISSFTEDDLGMNQKDGGTGQPHAGTTADDEARDGEFAEELNEYHCESCGAEVLTDKSTVADFCYYCHNPIVLTDRVSGAHKPEKIIPFKFDKEQAKDIFLRYAKKKWFLPRDYFSPEQSDKITGIYYPFWVVDADTTASLNATGHKVRTWRTGNYRYTETSHFAVRRGGQIHFEDISASAISTEDKAMLEGILPYPLNEHIDFSIPYLQGYQAKKRDIARDDLSHEVRARMEGYSEQLLSGTVNGYSSVTGKDTDIHIEQSHWDYTLMPIWMLSYNRKGKHYTYAMNGSTGKIYGELPVSVPKLIALGSVVGVLVGVLSFLIGWGMLG